MIGRRLHWKKGEQGLWCLRTNLESGRQAAGD